MSGWFNDWNPNQKFFVTMVVILGLFAVVLPRDVWAELVGFSKDYMDRDEVWQTIEDYIDQDLGGSPYQTEKEYQFVVHQIDVGGTIYTYAFYGSTGRLWIYDTEPGTNIIRWAIGNSTSTFVRNGTYYCADKIILGDNDYLIGECAGCTILVAPNDIPHLEGFIENVMN